MERFIEKVNKTETCWLWTSGFSLNGYGQFTIDYQTQLAHRIAYELFIGPIPNGLQIDHLCRVRYCVNPQHLEAVTCRENLMRGETHAARLARQTHCKNGHAFEGQNVAHDKDGWRRCRTCARNNTASYRARQCSN